MDEEIKITLWAVGRIVFFVVLASVFVYRVCKSLLASRGSNTRKIQKEVASELVILQEASQNVSDQLFPTQKLSTILRRIVWPWMTPTTSAMKDQVRVNNIWILFQRIRLLPTVNKKHHYDRLWILGSALWCRQQTQGHDTTITTDELVELVQSLAKADDSPPLDDNCYSQILPCHIKVIAKWAIVPEDRLLVEYCWDALVWAMRNQDMDVPDICNKRRKETALPVEVLTILLEELVASFNYSQQQTQLKQSNIPDQEEPDLIPGSSEQLLESSTESESIPLMLNLESRDSIDKRDLSRRGTDYASTAQRIYRHFQRLNVFELNDHDTDKSNTQANKHVLEQKSSPSFQKLRSGLLQDRKAPPGNNLTWIQPFIQRLWDQQAQGALSSPLKNFYSQKLPSFMLHLRSYGMITPLLRDNQSFALWRIQALGLPSTVHQYIDEWTSLQASLQVALLATSYTKDCFNSPVLSFLFERCLSQAQQLSRPSVSKKVVSQWIQASPKHRDRQLVALACFRLGSYALNHHPPLEHKSSGKSSDVGSPCPCETAIQLLQQARHLQVLVLGEICQRIAHVLLNLATTLHVRSKIKRKKQQGTALSNSELSPAKLYYDVNFQMRKHLNTICKQDRNSEDVQSLEQIMGILCKVLIRSWTSIQPTLPQTPLDQSSASEDGVKIRQMHVYDKYQQARNALQALAATQSVMGKYTIPVSIQTTYNLHTAAKKLSL